MRFLAYPIKNLRRRPGRTLFAAIGISLAIATFVSMTVLFGGITDQWKTNLDADGLHLVILQDKQIDWLASSLPESVAAEIADLPSVRSADGELLSFLTTENGIAILVSGWPSDSARWSGLELVAGARPPADANDMGLMGETAASALGLGIGDTLALDGLDVEIAGIFKARDVLTGGRLFLPLTGLQKQMFRDGTVTLVNVMLERPESSEGVYEVESFVATNYPSLSVRQTAQLSQDNRVIDFLKVLRRTVVWIVSLIGVAGTANIMLMAVNERRSEIGLLVALGWSRIRIVSVFLAEGVALSSVSGLVGVGLGAVIIELVRRSATLAVFLSGTMSLAVALQALALAVGIGTVSSILPAIRAVNVPADTALRSV